MLADQLQRRVARGEGIDDALERLRGDAAAMVSASVLSSRGSRVSLATKSMCGSQVLSHKSSAPSFSFGSGRKWRCRSRRRAAAALPFSRIPVAGAVLIAEDNVFILQLTEELLRAAGVSVQADVTESHWHVFPLHAGTQIGRAHV